MASGPLPLGSRPHKKSAHELDRIIGRLNDTFALQLCKPDVTLSPRKNRERRRNDEEARVDSIYQKIRQMYYTGDDRLAEYIGHFEQRGRKILSESMSQGSNHRITAENRALLQQCLLDILCEVYDPESRQWSKRESEAITESSPKRAKGRLYEHHDAVDALPVRSRDSFANISTVIASESRFRGESFQPLPRQKSLDRTFLSTRTSFHSEVLSTQTPNTSFISQTSLGSESPNQSNNYPFSQNTEANFSSEASYSSQDENKPQQLTNISPRGKEEFNGRSQYHHNSQSQTIVPSSSHSRQDSSDWAGNSLDERLAKIWPKLPHPELTEAPLAVIWEITRAALHCNVSLDQFDLLYEPTDKWHNQRNLRDTISKHQLFHDKSLPQSSDSAAWETALGTFQTKVKTVALSAELIYNQDPTGPLYNLRLHPLKLELGHRLARRFGADRFLEITFPPPSASSDDKPKILEYDKDSLKKIVDWLIRSCHYLLGRFWRPFFVRTVKGKKASGASKGAPPERLYLFAYDGDKFRIPNTPDGIPLLKEALEIKNRKKMKLSDLLRWAINIDNQRNSEQPVTKLFSRLALSLSRTWPTVELERHQIRIRTEDLRMPGGEVMNDGIGRISPSLAKKVTELLGLTDCPSCFQGRFGSAKGMWLIDVDSEGDFEEDFEEDWVEIYPSQIKWECDFKDLHHRTLEIRNWPFELKSASLNQQFIPVLEAQSKRPEEMRWVMSGHLQRALHADLGEQKDAMEDPMSLRLWIHQSGPSKNDRSLDGHAQFLAGLPNSNADKVAFLLDSGFDQRRMEYLKDVILDMCQKKADTLKTKMNITIPCSAYVYMAADFSSTLEAGEVHLSFSTKFQAEGFSDTLLEQMDILVARAPAHLPSDIQRVKVVSRPELRKLKDVIIFSTKGSIPLAAKLSGGDYDGDIAWVCWDQSIVKNFQNARVPEPMDFIKGGYLRKNTTKFTSILDSVAGGDYNKNMDSRSKYLEDACLKFISQAFLFNLQPSFLGRCTKYKERLCYSLKESVRDKRAIHLSQLLSDLVDQSKQGIEFTDEDWKRFMKNQLRMKGTYLEDPEYSKEKGERPRDPLHILDYLRFDVAEKVIREVLTDLTQKINANGAIPYDEDLTKLYNMYDERANGKDEGASYCRQLRTHLRMEIDALRDEWRISMRMGVKGIENSTFANKVEAIYQKWLDIKPPEGLLASGHFPELLYDSNKDSAISNWELLKASTTFKRHDNSPFAWHMAGKQLAYIKAMAHRVPGDTSKVLMVPEMWGVLRPDKKLIMSLSRQREAARDPESVVALEEVFEFDDDGTVIDDA